MQNYVHGDDDDSESDGNDNDVIFRDEEDVRYEVRKFQTY